MADNTPIVTSSDPAARKAAADQVTYSGDTADVQLVKIVTVSGAEGSKTTTDVAFTDTSPLIGVVTETAPATDTASSGLNGRLQRIAQRLTSLIALLPAALGSGGGMKVDGSGTALPVSIATAPVLVAGSAVIGKVGIDQTTPGTTNAVEVVQATMTMTHSVGSATSTTSAMLASNASRKYALLQNIGSVDVDIKLNASAVAAQGIRLQANGGSYEMSRAFGNLDTRAINGITASGTASVLVTEGA